MVPTRRLCDHPARDRHLVTFCIHALDVGGVIPLLRSVRGGVSSAASRGAAKQQADTCTNCGTVPSVDRGSRSCAQYGACHGTLLDTFIGGLIRCHAPNLLLPILPASVIIRAKLIEALGASRQHGYARTARQSRAAAENRKRHNRQFKLAVHWPSSGYRGGDGGITRLHPGAHSSTYG
jgi:hypothetical protein